MNNKIDITTYQKVKLPVITSEEAQRIGVEKDGWSFSFVYHLEELRDIYIALSNHRFTNHKEFASYCREIKVPFHKTPWNERRILEHLNALKNFGLVDADYLIKQSAFADSKVGGTLTEKEKETFRCIFFSYFRFKEIMTWFIDPEANDKQQLVKDISYSQLEEDSYALFPFAYQEKFVNSFLRNLQGEKLYFLGKNEHNDFKRFWDVFISWGKALGVIQRLAMTSFDYQIEDASSFACVYFPKKNVDVEEINVIQFIRNKFFSRYIRIPDLIFHLCSNYRLPLELAKNLVIETYLKNKELLSLERTSEIFIKKRSQKADERDERVLFPIYKDSFVSHIVLRR